MVVCPYNKSHLIIRSRLPAHLLKCVKHYNGEVLMQCPFNAMHLFPEREKEQHFEKCVDNTDRLYEDNSMTSNYM